MRYVAPPEAHVRVFGQVVQGHGVASGQSGDPRFPDGTLAAQWPHFEAVDDLPLDGLWRGTLNVSTAPRRVRIVAAWWTVRGVRWHPDVPVEDFSFVPCVATVGHGQVVEGLVYHPHPETKPDHPQPPEVLELLLPRVTNAHEGAIVRLDLPASQVDVEGPEVSDPAARDEEPDA